MSESLLGPLSQVKRIPDRGHYDPQTVHSVLDAAFLCHLGFAVDGQPFVIPTLFARRENILYMHGSSASRMLRELQKGIRACVNVTLVDGLVLARAAFHHSMNYRSVVAFGTAVLVSDEQEKLSALEAVSEHVIPGRWREVRLPNPLELKATSVIRFTIEEASAKVRTGGPKDDAEDYELEMWAGVLPLHATWGQPIPDALLKPGIAASAAARVLRQAGSA
jgi:uncharacterized protein